MANYYALHYMYYRYQYDECPEGCTCYSSLHENLHVIDCENANLAALPEIRPEVTHLFLDGNNFGKDFATENLENLKSLEHVTVLYLNNSEIEGALSAELFSKMADLKQLYLHDNALTQIPELHSNPELNVLTLHGNKITQVNLTVALSKLTYLKELTLSGNTWSCTCSFLLPFKVSTP